MHYTLTHTCTWEKRRERSEDESVLHMRTSASATLNGEWAVPLCACQEVWEWSHTQTLYTAVISLSGCVQGVCMRVARVGGRCAVVWLASEWCSVCCTCTEGSPCSYVRSQSLIVLGLVASEHTLSHPYLSPPPGLHSPLHTQCPFCNW